MTDSRARRARRGALRQANSEELAGALQRVAVSARQGDRRATEPDMSYPRMVAEHARIIRSAADTIRARIRADA